MTKQWHCHCQAFKLPLAAPTRSLYKPLALPVAEQPQASLERVQVQLENLLLVRSSRNLNLTRKGGSGDLDTVKPWQYKLRLVLSTSRSTGVLYISVQPERQRT